MHIIPNERALAHWQALYRLPVFAAELLKDRFIREQPCLAATLLALTGGTQVDTDGRPAIRPENDPKREDFQRLSVTAALLAEVVRREAGRPLRTLEAAETSELVKGNLELFKIFREAAETAPDTAPEIFGSCAQPNLLAGVLAATKDDSRITPEKLTLECYLLRVVIEGLHLASGGEAATTEQAWDAERILVALASQGDPLRREAIAASEAFRAELTPQLIAELESWVEDPTAALEEDGSLGTHGLFLLAKWREDSAWPVIRRLFSLPGEETYDLLGDLITEDGSVVLALAGGKRRQELQEMIEDPQVDEYCRNACLDALACQVAWSEWPRAELVAYLRELLTGRLQNILENEHVFGGAVSVACDLEAWELRPEVEAVFQRGVVDDGFVDLDYFLDAQAGRHPNQWRRFCESHPRIDDVSLVTKWLDNSPRPEPDLPVTPPQLEDFDYGQIREPYIAPPKVGRNDPCPCGSGKKYKKCCGG